MERLERVHVALEHELDVAAGDAHARGEEVHQEAAPLAKGGEVGGHVRLAVRLPDVGRADGGVGVLRVDDAPHAARGAALGNLARLPERVAQPDVRHVVPARRDHLARLLALVRVLPALQPEAHRGVRRLGVVALPLAALRLLVERAVRRVLRGVRVAAQLRPPPLVVLAHHRVQLLLLGGEVAEDLARRDGPHVAVLLRAAAVRAVLDLGLLRRGLVQAVVAEHVRVLHGAHEPRLVRVDRVLLAVEEAQERVAVLLPRELAALLRLLQDGRAVLVKVPEYLEQAVGRLDAPVHLVRQRRAEEVGDRRVVTDVEPAVVPHVLRRLEVAVRVVPVARVAQRRVDAERLALDVQHARERRVDPRVRRVHAPRLEEALVVVRDGRADRVPAAKLGVLGELLDLAAGRRVVGDVAVEGSARVALGLAADRLEHAQPVAVVADPLPVHAGRPAQVVVRHEAALQLVLPLVRLLAHVLGQPVDQSRALDVRVLLHELPRELVVREALVKDELVQVDAVELLVLVVAVAQAPAELHRRLLALGGVVRLAVRAVGVALELAVEPLAQLLHLLRLHVRRARVGQLRVVVGAQKALGRAHGQHADERARRDRARLRRRVRLRLKVAHVLGVLLQLPGGDEAHLEHACRSDLLPDRKRRGLVGPLRPGAHQGRAEHGRHRINVGAVDLLRPPGQAVQALVEQVRRRRRAIAVSALALVEAVCRILIPVLAVLHVPLEHVAPLVLVVVVHVLAKLLAHIVGVEILARHIAPGRVRGRGRGRAHSRAVVFVLVFVLVIYRNTARSAPRRGRGAGGIIFAEVRRRRRGHVSGEFALQVELRFEVALEFGVAHARAR